ncbi:MFS transporter [Micromonospora sp. LOL_024]|uniref:MFS transporter n=1 Tax=Micromonospora sp. LOL_024 TaxID=3345412 RepID=UPI003A857324
MTSNSARARRLAGTLYAYAFLTDLVLLYPVYALLFADTGLSIAQISSLFVIWSLTGIALEVPCGAWADATSRRWMLCLAPLCTAAGFALWTLAPSYPAFAVGFVLWGAGGALASGATEALIFDELDRLDAADRYARVIGRARTAGTVGVLGAIVLASPVLGLAGYPAVGAASVAACLLAAGVATRFPEHRRRRAEPAVVCAGAAVVDVLGTADGATGRPPDDTQADDLRWWPELRAGVAEVRADRAVRAAVLLVAAVTAVWGALDEYTPLLARDTGVPLMAVPLLLLIVTVGQVAGGLLAPVGERLRTCGYAVLLACSALALAFGALLGRPAGFLLVAVAFCGLQLASVLAEARLQARISGPARATVTSLAGMGTDLTIIAVYVGYGLVATVAGNAVAFAVAAVPYLLVAAALIKSARARRPSEPGRAGRASGAAVPAPVRIDGTGQPWSSSR